MVPWHGFGFRDPKESHEFTVMHSDCTILNVSVFRQSVCITQILTSQVHHGTPTQILFHTHYHHVYLCRNRHPKIPTITQIHSYIPGVQHFYAVYFRQNASITEMLRVQGLSTPQIFCLTGITIIFCSYHRDIYSSPSACRLMISLLPCKLLPRTRHRFCFRSWRLTISILPLFHHVNVTVFQRFVYGFGFSSKFVQGFGFLLGEPGLLQRLRRHISNELVSGWQVSGW
jgi:hypothetical protein